MRQSLCSHPNRQSRRGLTLVELLVTITILSMLASIVLFAMSQAQEKARANRTQAIIRKLDNIVSRYWESYQTRRCPMQIPLPGGNTPYSPRASAEFRLHAMRQMQMYEMPDRYNEFITLPSTDPITGAVAWANDPPYTVYNSPIHQAYFTRARDNTMVVIGAVAPTIQNQAAECLYLIVMQQGGAGATTSQENFAWGDVDRDGMREFLDGWGRPISWIRWPAGFLTTAAQFLGERQTGDVTNDHDPFDPLQIDTVAFRMHPLIYSAGQDGLDGIITNSSSNPNWSYRVNGTRNLGIAPAPPWAIIIDPYASLPGIEGKIGQPIPGRDWRDNIHNHMQAYK